MLLRAARAYAAADRRDFVIPDDVKALAAPVLGHRLIVTADAAMAGRDTAVVIADLLATVEVPVAGARLMLTPRGISVAVAGVGMWVAARFLGSPGLEIVAIGLAAAAVHRRRVRALERRARSTCHAPPVRAARARPVPV